MARFPLPPPTSGQGTRPLTKTEQITHPAFEPTTRVGVHPIPLPVRLWAGKPVSMHPATARLAASLQRPIHQTGQSADPAGQEPLRPGDLYFVSFPDRGRRPQAPVFGLAPHHDALEAAARLTAFWQASVEDRAQLAASRQRYCQRCKQTHARSAFALSRIICDDALTPYEKHSRLARALKGRK